MRGSVLGHRRDWIAVGAGALVLGLLPSPVRGDGEEVDEVLEEAFVPVSPKAHFVGEAGFSWQGESDVQSGGDVEVKRTDLGFGTRTELHESLDWNNSVFLGMGDYDFDGAALGGAAVVGKDPWDTALNLRLGSRLSYEFDEHWGISGGGVLIFSPEDGADWGDSITGGGTLGAEYRSGDTLFVSLGVAVISQLEDSVAVAPAVGLNWLPHERWAVRVGAVPASGGAAAAAEVAYQVAGPVELGLGALYNERRFRLNDSGVQQAGGVGEDNSLPVRLRLGWDVTQHITLNAFAGAVLAGQLTLENSAGNRLSRRDYDPAPYLGARVTGRF